LGHVFLLAFHQVLKGLPNTILLFHKFLEYLLNGIKYSTIDRDYFSKNGVNVGNIPLLDNNIPSVGKRMTIEEKKLISKIKGR